MTKRFITKPIAILACLAAMAGSAPESRAETTEWAENEGGRMRLVVLAAETDGRRDAMLEIEPRPGWITYWREPGDSGIPPQLSLEAGTPFALSPLAFPRPKLIVEGDIRDIAYDHPVRLPFSISGPATGDLHVTAFIGICRNICIPFQAEFALKLVDPPLVSPEEAAAIDRAKAELPPGPTADFAVKSARWSDDRKRLDVALILPQQKRPAEPAIFVTGPSGYVFTRFEGRMTGGGIYEASFPIDKLPRNHDPRSGGWSILAMAGDRALETVLAFE